jgi:hypothetical protein
MIFDLSPYVSLEAFGLLIVLAGIAAVSALSGEGR